MQEELLPHGEQQQSILPIVQIRGAIRCLYAEQHLVMAAYAESDRRHEMLHRYPSLQQELAGWE